MAPETVSSADVLPPKLEFPGTPPGNVAEEAGAGQAGPFSERLAGNAGLHPGGILLEEFLNLAGGMQTTCAGRIWGTRTRLNEFIHGKRGVAADAEPGPADGWTACSRISAFAA